jgi:enoyl-[acyl-carrier-protein] reductase (NADH)
MKLIIVTEMDCFMGKVDIACSCVVNNDEADTLVEKLRQKAEHMGLHVHCITPDTQHEAMTYLDVRYEEMCKATEYYNLVDKDER